MPTPPAPPRALALDLDGTLLEPDGTLAPHVAERLGALAAGGVRIVLVSGRMQPAVEPAWRELRLDTPIVSYNGCRIARPGEPPLQLTLLPETVAREAVAVCHACGIHVNLYHDDRLYVFDESDIARDYAAYYDVPLHVVGSDGADPVRATTKVLAITTEARLPEAFGDLSAALGGKADLTTSSRRYVEILPRGVNKGAALATLAGAFGIPLAEWVAVGDGRNDAEMIAAAGTGVAIRGSDPAALEAADLVVDPLGAGGVEALLAEVFPARLREAASGER
jgi:hypothetical protein